MKQLIRATPTEGWLPRFVRRLRSLLRWLNRPKWANHYCPAESGSGEWSHRSMRDATLCHYCETSPACNRADYFWIQLVVHDVRSWLRRFWKKVVLRHAVCSWRGHKYDDTEWGHMIGSKTHDEWCSRCDKFRGIPCAEHPQYD